MQQDVANQYKTPENLTARGNLHARYSVNPKGWLPWVFDILAGRLPEKAGILEAGCGPGFLWEANHDRIPSGWRLTLSDFSEGMLNRAREVLSGVSVEADYVRADVQRLPFDTNAFDAVIANHMLYHVPDIALGLSEIRRVLIPNGILFAATNGTEHMRELYDLIDSFDPGVRNGRERPVTRFCLENGADMLRAVFTGVSRTDYPDSLSIDTAQPLVDYICSMAGMGVGIEPIVEKRDELYLFLDALIRKSGPVHIGKNAGVFIAS
jgi:SAM-dependent methyltransferase